jgi:hypothetical protein
MQYSLLWSFNPTYATNMAAALGLTPVRDSSGEMMLTYPAAKSTDPTIPLPGALRVMVWSDAQAIQQKIDLAKRLGVRGISIFKIDGGQDPAIFTVLSQYQFVHQDVKPTIDGTRGGGSIAPDPIDTTTTTTVTTTVAAPSIIVPTHNLQTGSISADVKLLQKYLNAKGYKIATTGAGSPGHETTTFGAATRAALIRYQKAKKITPASGYFGALTRATMVKSA